MITFSVGLVLRIGERTLEFERDLGKGQLQFKYQDNHQVVTFGWGKLYSQILSGEVHVVHQNGHSVYLPGAGEGDVRLKLPLQLSDAEVAYVDNCMIYVKHCLRAGVPRSYAAIKAAIEAMPPRKDGTPHPSAWTVRHWLKKYKESGANPLALVDRRPRAPRKRRLSTDAESHIDEGIHRHYLQKNGPSAAETARRIIREIQTQNRVRERPMPLPSTSTIQRRINEIEPFIRDYKRIGPAFARNKWRFSLKGDTSTRVLERIEIDHTLLDIWVLDPRTGVPIGRPWITVLIDRYSGYILGFHISFYGPSVGSVAAAIRNAILPKDEILASVAEQYLSWTAMGTGEQYVVDNGLEFHSNAFLRLVWHLRADIIFNPVRQPWLKGSIERCMMEVCRILPAAGKVYTPLKNADRVLPQDSAAILFDDLCVGLLIWASDVFPKRIHPKRLIRPLDLWEEGRLATSLPMFPLTMSNFDIVSGISTERTIDGDGVFFKYLRFNSTELQDYRRSHGQRFRTEIRFNPDDLGLIHVYLPKAQQWLPVELMRPGPDYGRGLSLIQHEIIRAQAGKKLTQSNAAAELCKAWEQMTDFWGDATKRGIKVRKDGDLIRLQGLTSAKVFSARGDQSGRADIPPETSEVSLQQLKTAMPFPGYSIEEEEYQ